MAAASLNLVSEDEYLHTIYHPDCDFVDGVVVERNLGQFDHSNLQTWLAFLLVLNREKWGVIGLVEQRLRVRHGRYRIPDVVVLPLDYDRSQKIVRTPPLLCIEVLSPDDTMPRIIERCWEYNALGVPEIWIFNPESKQVFIARYPTVTEFKEDTLRCGKIEVSLPELFSKL